MKQKNTNRSWMPVFLCWLAYTTAYLGRYSYTANVTAIIETFGTDHAAAGLANTEIYPDLAGKPRVVLGRK